jgi:2-polyprenyl-3-methyl-5-hydroxy-6-metoxy-1,4-benzoquinol methylase
MARAFPASRFYGFDVHDESLMAARRNARDAGVAERVQFERANAVNYNGGPYDVVCFFDALHDMGDPVAAVRRAAEQLAPGGVVLAVEPFANDRVEDSLTPVGKLYYAASTMLCVAHSLSEPGGAALGAQAGPAKLEAVFRKAGFRSVKTALQTPFNLVLEARK